MYGDRVTHKSNDSVKYVVMYHSHTSTRESEIICDSKETHDDVSKGLELLQKMSWFKYMLRNALAEIEKFEKEAELVVIRDDGRIK
jgi:hypothetical protein